MHRVVLAWQEAHARIGQQLEMGERLCFGFHFYLAKNREQGIRQPPSPAEFRRTADQIAAPPYRAARFISLMRVK